MGQYNLQAHTPHRWASFDGSVPQWGSAARTDARVLTAGFLAIWDSDSPSLDVGDALHAMAVAAAAIANEVQKRRGIIYL